jgi:hypothetical protein
MSTVTDHVEQAATFSQTVKTELLKQASDVYRDVDDRPGRCSSLQLDLFAEFSCLNSDPLIGASNANSIPSAWQKARQPYIILEWVSHSCGIGSWREVASQTHHTVVNSGYRPVAA